MKKYILKFKFHLLFNSVITMFNAALSVVIAFILAEIVNSAVDNNMERLKYASMISIAYVFIYLIVSHMSNYFTESYSVKVMSEMKDDLFDAVMKREYKDFYEHDSEYYMQNFTTYSDSINESFVTSIFGIIHGITLLTLSIVSIVAIDYKIFIIAVVLGIIYVLISNIVSHGLTKFKNKQVESLNGFTSSIIDILNGYKVSKNYDNKRYIKGKFDKSKWSLLKASKSFNVRSANLNAFNLIFGQALIIAVIIVCSVSVISGNMKVGLLIAVSQLLVNMINPILSFIDISNNMTANKQVKIELLNLINYKNDDDRNIEKETFNEDIVINYLNFSYEKKKLFQNASMTFEKGKKYAIIGENGSGKSTLFNMIMSYNNQYDGQIKVDKENVRKLSDSSYKKLFALVDQEFYNYNDNIINNISFGEDKIKETAVSISEKFDIENLVDSYDINSKQVVELSGGERQKISLIRALAAEKPIILLDEANSKLDEKSAKKIMDAILSVSGLTVLAITHRLDNESLEKFDHIVEVKNQKLNLVR